MTHGTQDRSRTNLPVRLRRAYEQHTGAGERVLLMHDGGGDRSQTVEALRALLPELLAEGYRFTTPQ